MHDTAGKSTSPSPRWRKYPSKYDDLAVWSVWDASADTGMLMWVHRSSHPLAATAIIPHVCRADAAFTGPDTTESECWEWGCSFTSFSFRGKAAGKKAEGSGTSPSPPLASVNPNLATASVQSRSVPGTELAGVEECWVSTAPSRAHHSGHAYFCKKAGMKTGILPKGRSNSKTHWPKQLHC